VTESPDQTVDRALQEEKQMIQRLDPRSVVGGFALVVVHAGKSVVKKKLDGSTIATGEGYSAVIVRR
jgi:hypothetical protein